MKIKPHDFEMDLSDSDWMERYALHARHYYQDEVIGLLEDNIRPGHVVIDIGANIGFVSFTASRLVGTTGKVFSFEPNPDLTARLRRVIARNAIGNIELIESAVGATEGSIRLVREGHHGTSRIASAEMAPDQIEVPIRRVDDVLASHLPASAPVFVKIDVEGAEVLALSGMRSLLKRPDVQCLIEISDSQLGRFGASAAEIFAIFQANGFQAYWPSLSPLSKRLTYRAVGAPLKKGVYDLLFRKSKTPGGGHSV